MRGVDDVERAVAEHFHGQPGILGAVRDPNRCQVEDEIGSVDRGFERIDVADVSLDDLRPIPRAIASARLSRRPRVRVVEHDDLAVRAVTLSVDEQIDDVRTDQSGAACHEDLLERRHQCCALRRCPLGQRRDHDILLLVGHLREDRQGEHLVGGSFGQREVPSLSGRVRRTPSGGGPGSGSGCRSAMPRSFRNVCNSAPSCVRIA